MPPGRPSNAEKERRRQALAAQQPPTSPPPGAPPGPRPAVTDAVDPAVDVPLPGLDTGAADSARPKEDRVPRSTFVLGSDGEIDTDNLKDNKKSQILRAAARLGGGSGAGAGSSSDAGSSSEGFTPEQVSEFLTGLGWIQMIVATKVWGVPAAVARDIVPYDEHEKKLLAKPAARVLNKHTPAFLKKYADEITLLTMLGTVTGNKIDALQKWVEANVVPAPGQQPRKPATPPANAAQPAQTTTQPARVDGQPGPASVERQTH